MKLRYHYTVHGFSGGRMLSNTLSGEWDSLTAGMELDSPNSEVSLTVSEVTVDTVTLRVRYRQKEKTLTLSRGREESFRVEANAYGFTYLFSIKE